LASKVDREIYPCRVVGRQVLGNTLKATVLFAVVAILVVEEFFVYWFYQNNTASPPEGDAAGRSASASASASSGALEATTPGASDGSGGAGPAGPDIESVFVHRATPGNSRGDYTYLSDPAANGDPNAVVLVTATLDQEDRTYDDRNIGVWYEPEKQKWAIFNQDRAAIPPGTTFNVVVLRSPEDAVHRAAPANTVAYSTYLDHPTANGNPDAVLVVTPNWNPGGGVGIYNDHPVGVRYDPDRRRWAVFNRDNARIPQGAVFNVAVWEGA